MPASYAEACELIAAALGARREIVDRFAAAKDPLGALRAALKRNAFESASGKLEFQRIVASLDARSRKEGLHLVQAWDFGRHVFTEDSVAVLLLDYCNRLPSRKADDRMAVAVLLDQYFVSLLSLLAVRAWDEGDANANLDRVSELLRALQGPGGSGHQHVDDGESLMFLAISYFHPNEVAYDTLLARVEQLDAAHQLRVALACAGMMSAHLRWGLRFMYKRDVGRMRDDNVADYPWLSHAVATLAREHARLGDSPHRAAVAEALMLAMAADPWKYADGVADQRQALLLEFEAMRPSPASYSPLGFTCNFPTNAAVAMVAVSLEDGRSYPSLNALLSARRDPAATQELATRLMDYSVSDPSRLGAGQAPLIAYDPFDAAGAHNALLKCLRDAKPT